LSAKVRAFVDFLAERFAGNAEWALPAVASAAKRPPRARKLPRR
jgi:hypothetical protein